MVRIPLPKLKLTFNVSPGSILSLPFPPSDSEISVEPNLIPKNCKIGLYQQRGRMPSKKPVALMQEVSEATVSAAALVWPSTW